MPSSIIWIFFLIVSKPNVCQGHSYPFYYSILKQRIFFTDKVNVFFSLYNTCSTFIFIWTVFNRLGWDFCESGRICLLGDGKKFTLGNWGKLPDYYNDEICSLFCLFIRFYLFILDVFRNIYLNIFFTNLQTLF
jgi:hypothetical protein